MTKKEDIVVLSYFDCVIRESDLKILKSNGWLNDAIIGFYFVYLEKERFNSNSELLFIGPEVTQCLKESPTSDLPVFLDPLDAKNKDYIFMAVNDSGKSAGGSHWSLLVYSQQENKFYHIDSSSQTNFQPAVKLAHNIGRYFRPSLELDFVELSSLQQDNSYDCGIYLICNLENIAEHITSTGNEDVGLQHVPFVKKDVVDSMRKDLLDIIADCKKQQE
ncbi:SUMO1 sentrin specific peptidase 8 [Homalodisca vitripennis]|nr:SUMO1 sentrin specific peptidase 8 [Homalodisca vitripennis]